MKKEVRNYFIAVIVITLPIIMYVGENTKQSKDILERLEVLEVQQEQLELKAQKSTVIKTLNGTITINEGEDPEMFRYMHYVHTFSKDGYENEKDLKKSTGFSVKDSKTRWFTVTHYQEQQDGFYKEVEQDTYKRLAFLWQDISIEPKEYEGFIYNEEVSCSEIRNGLPSSILVEAWNSFNPEDRFYHTDITFDIKFYYDLVEE